MRLWPAQEPWRFSIAVLACLEAARSPKIPIDQVLGDKKINNSHETLTFRHPKPLYCIWTRVLLLPATWRVYYSHFMPSAQSLAFASEKTIDAVDIKRNGRLRL